MSATLDFATLRWQLAGLKDQAYWRGPEALAASPETQALMEAEFPGAAPLMDRRSFLQLMAASLAMAGLAACGKTPEQAVTAVNQPVSLTPDVAAWYATTIPFASSLSRCWARLSPDARSSWKTTPNIDVRRHL